MPSRKGKKKKTYVPPKTSPTKKTKGQTRSGGGSTTYKPPNSRPGSSTGGTRVPSSGGSSQTNKSGSGTNVKPGVPGGYKPPSTPSTPSTPTFPPDPKPDPNPPSNEGPIVVVPPPTNKPGGNSGTPTTPPPTKPPTTKPPTSPPPTTPPPYTPPSPPPYTPPQPLPPSTPTVQNKSDLLPSIEWDFRYGSHKTAGRLFTLDPFSLPVPGERGLTLNAVTCVPANGYRGYYERERVSKKRIVLHFTAGNIKSDINVLTKQKDGYAKWRLSVPFVIARDGTIYQLFGSGYWSYHLGTGAVGGNDQSSKESIGIELSNYGPLIRDGNNLLTVYSKPSRPDVYCTINETHKYTKLPTPHNGYQYFATYTDAQYESLIVLLRYLTTKYNIPRKFLPERKRYNANYETAMFKGINSHLNYRKTGKWDIGPAFQWNRVINGVTSSRYIRGGSGGG